MDANKIIKNYEELKSKRTPMESSWDELHKYFLAAGDEVIADTAAPDAKVHREAQYSDLPAQSLQVLSAGLHSFLTGPTNNWFALRAKDKVLKDNKKVKVFLEEIEDILRASISNTNFETEQDDFYSSSACYGSAVMYIEEDATDDLRFNTIPIKDIFWQENSRGKIDIWDIRYSYTAHQAIDRFGEDNVSSAVKSAYNSNEADDTKFEYILHVEPRHDRDETKKDIRNMPISITWVEVDTKLTVQEGGMLESPFAYHRWTKRKNTPYGYSPCMMAMKSVKQLNKTLKISVRAMSMAIDGAMDVPVNAYVGKIDLNPGKLNYRRGEDKMTPIRTNMNMQPADYLINMYSEAIKDGLYNKAIIAVGDVSKRMQNLEVQELMAEKMVLLGPAVGRFLDEFAQNVIERSLAILARRGKLPEPPEELGEGFEYEISFISPLAKAQRNNEAQSISATLEVAGGMASLTPEVIDNIDPDFTIREYADIKGATSKMFRTPEKVKEIRDARIKAQAEAEEVAKAQMALDAAGKVKEIENDDTGSGS